MQQEHLHSPQPQLVAEEVGEEEEEAAAAKDPLFRRQERYSHLNANVVETVQVDRNTPINNPNNLATRSERRESLYSYSTRTRSGKTARETGGWRKREHRRGMLKENYSSPESLVCTLGMVWYHMYVGRMGENPRQEMHFRQRKSSVG